MAASPVNTPPVEPCAGVPTTAPRAKPERLWFLDNLKVVLTVLVILHHTGQAYGPTGGFWYFQNPDRVGPLGFWFWVNASFFMGLFFLISGYFFPGSLDRHGGARFLTDKLIRFGVPILLFVLLVNPIMMWVSYLDFRGGSLSLLAYVREIYFGLGAQPLGWKGHWPDINFGHLWFVEHLLVYAALYALWRVAARRNAGSAAARTPPTDLILLAYALGLAAVTYAVRLWYPVDRWVGFLGFIQLEPAHLPQYASLFFLGMAAYRNRWLQTMETARGLRWFAIGLAAVALAAARRFGWLQSAGLALSPAAATVYLITAESFIAVGLSVGLITLFRERFRSAGPLGSALAAGAYGAYLIHFPLVVLAQYGAGLVPAGPGTRFLLAGGAAVILSFAGAHLLRKLPGAARIL